MLKLRGLTGIIAIAIILSFLLPTVMVGATTSMSVENILMLLAGLPLIIILWNKINVFPTGINMARIALILIVFLLVSDFLSQRVFGAGSIGMLLFLVHFIVVVFLYFCFFGYY